MLEFRWVVDECYGKAQLQYRSRSLAVDASGAICGVTEFGPWQIVDWIYGDVDDNKTLLVKANK